MKHKQQQGYCTLLPVPDNRKRYASLDVPHSYLAIELLFNDERLGGYTEDVLVAGGGTLQKFKNEKKKDFAGIVRGFDVSDFENFRLLFERIKGIMDGNYEK